jgi:hypothetical protein
MYWLGMQHARGNRETHIILDRKTEATKLLE